MDDDINSDLIREATRAKQQYAEELRRFPNVTGVGVGFRIRGGVRQPEVCIRVYVRQKLPVEALPPDGVLPSSIGGTGVDVIEADFVTHVNLTLAQRRSFQQVEVPAGVSVAGLRVTAGTWGAIVTDAAGRDLILSNWHVLCGSDLCQPGEPIVQPGPFDGGTESDIVARLTRFALTSRLDAACAELSGHRFALHDIAGIGRRPLGRQQATLGLSVVKSGRTTGVTRGVVSDIDADVDVRGYPGGIRRFQGQAIVESDAPPFSAPGDSGSLVLATDGRAVGLLFAGSSSYTIMNHIDDVAKGLQLDFGVHPVAVERDFIDLSIG